MYGVIDAALLIDFQNFKFSSYLFRNYIKSLQQIVNIEENPIISECV